MEWSIRKNLQRGRKEKGHLGESQEDYCLAGHVLWSAYQGYYFLLLQAFRFHLLLHKLLKDESGLGEEECRS